MSEKLLTVSEVARLANVTTQYIYKLLDNTLQPYVVMVDNKKRLKQSVITEFFKVELQPKLSTDTNQSPSELPRDTNQSQTNYQPDTTTNTLIDFFKDQMKNKDEIIKQKEEQTKDYFETVKQKDKQIEDLTQTITELSNRIASIAENSQSLQKNQQLLEAQRMSNEIEESKQEEPTEEPTQEKKTFWQKFRKNKK